MLPPRVAQNEKDDYTPEEWQLLYELQQFGHPFGNMPLITMIGMKEAEDRPWLDLGRGMAHSASGKDRAEKGLSDPLNQ